MASLIPVDPAKYTQSYKFQSGGSIFKITFYFLTRTNAWYFNLDDAAGTRLVSGFKLSAESYPHLLSYRAREGMPAGVILCGDLEGNEPYPSADEIGSRFPVFFIGGTMT